MRTLKQTKNNPTILNVPLIDSNSQTLAASPMLKRKRSPVAYDVPSLSPKSKVAGLVRKLMSPAWRGVAMVALGLSTAVHAADSTTLEQGMKADADHHFDFSKGPPITPMPMVGNFVKPPKGPGYFSLMDFFEGTQREKAPVGAHPPFGLLPTSAFDLNYRYVENPNREKHFTDALKRIHLGDDWLLSMGGSIWFRHMRERDSRLNATGIDNNYNLQRIRAHADLWYQDSFRVFAEVIDARARGLELPALPIDRNETDLLNLFMDVKLGEAMDGSAYLRLGRQELLYGSQRLISTLDWANTRRTFQGAKAFWHTPTFDVDAFWVRPLVTDPTSFDESDTDRHFGGIWATYKGMPNHTIDAYLLSLQDDRAVTPAQIRQGNTVNGDSRVHTLGGRFVGSEAQWMYELEGMYQFGQRSSQDVSAWAVSSGVGYHFPVAMNPQFWVHYDYASGDGNPNDGNSKTFNQLFPFGHYYMGFIDRVGRQNIHDLNMQFTLHPQNWLTVISQYHRFYLANKEDFLYNAAGAATLRDPTGRSGSHVGDELDIRVNVHIARDQDFLFGYSKLNPGAFLDSQRPGISPDFAYAQYVVRF